MPLAHRRVLAELTACRTPAMGTHETYCQACGEIFTSYNSCRNRHCVTCGGPARARWLDRVRGDLLPVPYFHLIFTLPSQLRKLVLANARPLYNLLIRAAWRTLKQLASDPRYLGGKTGAAIVLHTWRQDMLPHPHLHAVVPSGALSDTGRWISSRSPTYLFPYQALSKLFRGKFLAGLKRLHRRRELKLPGELAKLQDRRAWEKWLIPLYRTKWEVYCQPPPKDITDPDTVLKYLARYVVGGVISDRRLISHADGKVTFWARQGRGKQRRSQPLPLDGVEFVRRFLLHVLPRGFHRVRYYGLLANANRDQLRHCRQLLTRQDNDASAAQADESPSIPPSEQPPVCPSCRTGSLVLLQSDPRPSWREILSASVYAGQHWTVESSTPRTEPCYQDSS